MNTDTNSDLAFDNAHTPIPSLEICVKSFARIEAYPPPCSEPSILIPTEPVPKCVQFCINGDLYSIQAELSVVPVPGSKAITTPERVAPSAVFGLATPFASAAPIVPNIPEKVIPVIVTPSLTLNISALALGVLVRPLAVEFPEAGLIFVLLTPSPIICVFAGTTIGNASEYVPVLT